MKSRLLNQEPEKTFVLVFEPGEEVLGGLQRFARENALSAASFTAIGALQDVTLAWFDPDKKEYQKIPVHEQVEVVSLIGNVAIHKGAPKVHAHLVVAKKDGSALGGHLAEAHVRPTLEVVIQEAPVHLRRKTDEATGLALIDPELECLPPRGGRQPSEACR